MKLRVTLTVDIDVVDLKHFEAASLEEAALNQAEWYRDGAGDLVGDIAAGRWIMASVAAVDGTGAEMFTTQVPLNNIDR